MEGKKKKSKFDAEYAKKVVKQGGLKDDLEGVESVGDGKFEVFDDRNANVNPIPKKKVPETAFQRMRNLLSGKPSPNPQLPSSIQDKLKGIAGYNEEEDYDQTFSDDDSDLEIKISKPSKAAVYEPRGVKTVSGVPSDDDTEDDKEMKKRVLMKLLKGK